MISSSSEANPNASSSSSALASMSRKYLKGKLRSTRQKRPLSPHFYCRLGKCERPLETFKRFLTLLWVIPEQHRVDQLLNWWVRSGCVASSKDPYEAEEVLRRLNIDERISQKRFCSSPRSSRCREPSNPRLHTFLFPFSSLCTNQLCQLFRARNELLVMRLFCQKRCRTVENICREYLYQSNRKFPLLCLLFFGFLWTNAFLSLSYLFLQRNFRPKQYQHRCQGHIYLPLPMLPHDHVSSDTPRTCHWDLR